MDTPHPPSVTDALGNAGPLPVVNWNGKKWQVAYTTPAVIADIEEEVAASAYQHIVRMSRRLPPDAREEAKAAALAAVQANKFAFNQPAFWEVMGGPDGDDIMLAASLRVKHPEVTTETARRMRAEAGDEVDYAVARVTPSFFDAGADTLPLSPADKKRLAAELLDVYRKGRSESRWTPSPTSTPDSGTTPS